MSELIRKLKEKKFITKVKVKEDISDELLSKEITQRGSLKIVEEVKKEIGPVRPPYAVMRETNPELMDVCVANGWAANNDYMTYEEAAVITADMIKPQITGAGSNMWVEYKFENVTHFEEFEYFTGVEEIMSSTFKDCNGLTSIIIPDSVISIGVDAFQGCSSLTSINIPGAVTSIGENAFQGCSGLESMVVEIGNSKYDSRDNCNAIIETATNTLITGCMNTIIPDSVTSIGGSAFRGSGLTSITIPNSVTSIGDYAFNNCGGLTSIEIPNSVTSIGGSAFYNCSGLTSITIPDSVTSLGGGAFSNCSGLTNVIIGNFVTSIDMGTFQDCISLTSINIPNAVTSIGNSAFSNCRGLTSITIPNSVTSIGYDAFQGCTSLSSITCLATKAPTVDSSTFGSSNWNYTGRNTYDQGTNKLKVPTGATGYDTGAWKDPLQNAEYCGFTIEYI